MIPFIKCPLYSTLCLVPCSTPHSTLVSQTIGAWFAPGGSLVRACAAGALRTGGAASGCTGTQCGWQPGALYVHGTAPAAPPIVPALQPNTVRPVQRTACNTRRPNTRLRCRTLLHPTPSLSPQAADAPPCAPRPSAFARGCAALLRKACRPARAEAGRARCSGSGGDRAARLSARLCIAFPGGAAAERGGHRGGARAQGACAGGAQLVRCRERLQLGAPQRQPTAVACGRSGPDASVSGVRAGGAGRLAGVCCFGACCGGAPEWVAGLSGDDERDQDQRGGWRRRL